MDIGTKFGITEIFQDRFSDFTSHTYFIASSKNKMTVFGGVNLI